MQLKNKQNFWSGVMFIVLGSAFAWKSTEYSMGTAARMGPGYFPFWLGVIMAILGAIILVSSFAKKAQTTEISKFDFKSVAIITGAVVVFAYLLQPAGLIISMLVLVLISAAAAHDNNWKVTIANAIFLTVLCYLAFVVGLKLVFPIWPAFLGMN
ncbi:tripartite tricarboxylate transporter TctB family protein [Zwartia sp.]|uniref:tripartite tricarboxylate transporter TctB family protein n=1 Tax=Zwartia sp. TaxID=2978004 RepID=UPI003BAE61FC